jgi:hypothetical protein
MWTVYYIVHAMSIHLGVARRISLSPLKSGERG